MSFVILSRKRRAYLLLLLIAMACHGSQNQAPTSEWVQLFNGRDLADWTVKIAGYPAGENFGNTYRVEDGKVKVSYDGYTSFDERFGVMFHKRKYSAYLLGVEYRFIGEQAPNGPDWAIRNSGVMVHSQAPETVLVDQDFPISIEVQFLGGNGHDERPTANLCTPGTNVVIDGKLYTPHCISSTSRTYHGDQWVRVEVLVLADSVIEHIVEGETVLKYEKPQIGGGNVINYDASVKKDGTLLREGYIGLQSESHPVEFRKIEIFNLEQYVDDPQTLEKVLRTLGVRRE